MADPYQNTRNDSGSTRMWRYPHNLKEKYSVPEYMTPKYNLGDILADIGWNDDLSVITDIYAIKNRDGDYKIVYVHNDLSDMSRKMVHTEHEIGRFYKVL